MLNELANEIHRIAVKKGWWPDGDLRSRNEARVPEAIVLIHSEASEALEDFRVGRMEVTLKGFVQKPVGFPSELADIIIRTLDLAAALDIDIEGAVNAKLEYNKSRPHRHGENEHDGIE